MERITYPQTQSIGYPVGQYISLAIEHAQNMAKCFSTINEYRDKNLNIFCRGSSGAILSALFVSALNWNNPLKIHHIKKEGENSHTSNDFDILDNGITIIIDDLICSGSTIKDILRYTPYNRCDCLIIADSSSDQRIEKVCGFMPKYYITGASLF
jgi:orotate phosphoribosyltransferase-like protein